MPPSVKAQFTLVLNAHAPMPHEVKVNCSHITLTSLFTTSVDTKIPEGQDMCWSRDRISWYQHTRWVKNFQQ